MSKFLKVFVAIFLVLSSLSVNAVYSVMTPKEVTSRRPIPIYFESQSLGTTSNGCTIHIYVNANVEINAQGQITSFTIYNSGYFTNCPQTYYAKANFSATHDQSRVTSWSLDQSTGNSEIDAVLQDVNIIEEFLDEFNDAIENAKQ